MKHKKHLFQILVLAVLLMLNFQAFAQGESKIENQETEAYDPIIASLDSLVSLNYTLKYLENSDFSNTDANFSKGEIPSFTDEVYAARIARLQTPIPLTFNAEVKQYLELYAMKRRGTTQRVMGLSYLYFPLFEQILDQEGIPLEMKYLAIVESALNPVAVSRMGATGIWQFMLGTGKMYDLKINSYIDERRDPVKSTYAACKYFKDMYAIYNDWLLVIASYNCGPGNVNRAIARSGGKRTFWEISPYLPKETRGYVPAFIAVTYLLNYANEHNLVPVTPSITYFETDTVMVEQKVSLRDVAANIDIPTEVLSYLNPVYKKGIIPESEEPMPLRLPVGKINSFIAALDKIYQPNQQSASLVYASVQTVSSDYDTHTSIVKKSHLIKRGEHLSMIAGKYRVSVQDIRKWNNLKSNHLIAGKYLTVYVKKTQKAPAATETVSSQKSNQNTETKQADTPAKTTSSLASSNDSNIVYHVVQPGDTLWAIAKRYEGVTVEQIKQVNKLNSNDLKVGTKLKVLLNS
ncbi:MAG: LysM peptidoglycan-binding domain-containing protein [Bacteroidetes bacterium]|nr:MAG: LysM peptidoglycan-binding domain-containing protein [Bacteroidota bacterium]REK04694.1 MAG: LysM peptidoglycan-binding domain-containing protein [Bacteroidota bacterium]REK36169.1 MAG: LysM peptidoglycan-binding domain-containing protein [Bacteroidota bacterium]REK51460.1 MAG: LysM peptidoglycan-binding domain-containing protein [Bacteroidota bacterium]